MLKRIYFNLVEKYFDIIENGIIQYHYIDTNFDNYSELVSNLVKSSLGYAKKINQKPVFFTGLCLPLYRWFNYSSLPTKLIKKNEIAKVKISSVWYNYLDSIQKLSKDYDVYRCILMIKNSIYDEITSDNTTSFDKEFKSIFKNYNFLPQISYFSQKNELYIIYDGNRPLELFSIKKLKELSLDYSYYDKKIDDENDLFFNIQDKQSCSLPEGFCCEPLGRFFSNNFQEGSKIKVYSFSDS